MWLSSKKNKLDSLYKDLKNLIKNIEEKINDPSLHIDKEYFAEVRKHLEQIQNNLKKDDIQLCITTYQEAQKSFEQELDVIQFFNETEEFVKNNVPGSFHQKAKSHQKEAISYIKRGMLQEAIGEIKKAKIAAEPSLDFLIKELKRTHKQSVHLYDNGKFTEALKEFTQEKNEFLDIRQTAINRSETIHLETIALSLTEVERFIKEIENLLHGESLETNGNYREALVAYKTCITINPQSYWGSLHLADIYLNLSEFQKAIEYYSEILEHHPKNQEVLYKKGLALFKNGQIDSAFSLCGECLAVNPNYVAAHQLKDQISSKLFITAEELQKEKKYDDAIKIYDTILQIDPFNALILSRKGDAYLEMRDFDSALKYFQFALLQHPNYALATKGIKEITNSLFQQAEDLRGQKEFLAAITLHDKILQIFPTEDRFYYAKTLCLESLSDYTRAVDTITKALEFQPDSIEYLKRKISYLVALQKYQIALDTLDILIKYESSNIENIVLKASLLWKIGDKEEALDTITSALILNPENSLICDEKQKYVTLLKEEIRNSIYSEDFQNAQNYLIIALKNDRNGLLELLKLETEQSLKKQDYNASVFLLNKIHDIEPSDVDVLHALLNILIQLEKYHDALDRIEDLLRIEPKNIDTILLKSSIQWKIGKKRNAFNTIETALTLFPENIQLTSEKEKLLAQLKDEVRLFFSPADFQNIQESVNILLKNNKYDLLELFKNENEKTLTEGNLRKATFQLRKIYEIEPTDTDTLQKLVNTLIQIQEYPEALNRIEDLINYESHNINTYILKSALLMKIGKKRDAFECIEHILGKNPENIMLKNEKENLLHQFKDEVKSSFSTGKYQDIRQQLSILLKNDRSGLLELLKHEANQSIVEEDFKRAIFQLNRILEIEPSDVDVLNKLLKIFIQYQEHHKVLEVVNQLIKCESKNIDYYILKSSVLWELGKKKEALDCITAILKLDPGNSLLLKERKKILTQLKYEILNSFSPEKFQKIQYQFDIVLNNDKNDLLEMLNYEADQSIKDEKFKKAEFQLNKIHELDSSNYDVVYKIAHLNNQLKEPHRALRLLNQIPKQHKLFELAKTQKEVAISSLFDDVLHLISEKKFHDAISTCDIILSYDPANGRAYKEKGKCFEKIGNKLEAISCYTTANKLIPDDFEVFRLLGFLLYDVERYKESLPNLVYYLKHYKEDDECWYRKGVSHEHLQQYHKALEAYDIASNIDPENSTYLAYKAGVLEVLDKNDEALQCYEKVLKLDPKNDTYWNNKGYVLRKLGRYDEAVISYEKAQKLAPQDDIIKENIEQLVQNIIEPCKNLFSQKEYQKALVLSCFILKNDVADEEIQRIEAYSLFHTQQYKKSISKLNHLLTLNPTNDYDWFTLGKAYSEIDELEKAVDCFNMALKIDGNNIDASTEKNSIKGKLRIKKENQIYIKEAKEWYDYKSYSRALKSINKAFLNTPDDPTIIILKNKILKKILKEDSNQSKKYLNEGDRFFDSGDYSAAAESYQISYDLNPSDISIKIKLENAQKQLNRNKIQERHVTIPDQEDQDIGTDNSAVSTIDKMSEKDEYSLILKGASFFKIKMYQQAIECFNKALEKNPKNAIAWYNKGLVLEVMKQKNKALLCFDKSLWIDPSYIEAKTARSRILPSKII
jgi:tetratricopeptide (TPR) repeat protein